jgi:arylsulfatase A-like enzyme
MSHRPNVLLITTDHWPAALLGSAGQHVIQTPTLDQLARSGVRFSNAYSECPVCIPARRTLMTGTPPKIHGDRTFQTTLEMPDLPTLAQTFRDADYQAIGVGKLHVYPQRNRIGFDEVILAEEGRPGWGVTDDYEIFLGDQGFAGRQFDHGMSNNEYVIRPWHLPEDVMSRTGVLARCRA